MVRPMTGSAHADGWFSPVVLAHAKGWFVPLLNTMSLLKSAMVNVAHVSTSSGFQSGGILRIFVLAHSPSQNFVL